MEISHHLQRAIVEKLTQSSQPISYSALKQPDIENSLFSYHLNKLVSQGIVQKEAQGYLLTAEGARWLNDKGFGIIPEQTLRVNVMLIVKNEDEKYLIAQRAGQYKTTINDYLFPGHYFTNNDDLTDQVNLAIDSYIPRESLIETTDYGFAQIKIQYPEITMYNLFHLTRCQVKQFDLHNPYYALELEWLTKEQVDTIDHPSASILRQVIDFTDDDKNSYNTPLFTS